jgi:uncharacterized membrane protein
MGSHVTASSRLSSIDAIRGTVMIIMALDHVRDFFHASAISFSPTDLTKTTPILFFTRWITHFCLPVFMFAAGMGAFLYGQRGRTRGQLSRFLLTRGLWFIVLELTVMRLAYDFSFSLSFPVLLLILWIFGVCMIVMSALVHLPVRWLTALSLVVIVLHDCLDGIDSSKFGSGAWVWNLLHQPGAFRFAGEMFVVAYPLVPWVAVMAVGYCFGHVFLLEPAVRRTLMLRIGLVASIGFFVVRAINLYGDPVPWAHQKSAIFTVLSFLNCTKYPASLDFLLMTLGPAILLLAYFDGRRFKDSNPIIVFGRVPMFYFVLHFLSDTHAVRGCVLAPLRDVGCPIHIRTYPIHGRASRSISSEPRLSVMGRVWGVDSNRGTALSALPMVCKRQSQAAGLVAELSLALPLWVERWTIKENERAGITGAEDLRIGRKTIADDFVLRREREFDSFVPLPKFNKVLATAYRADPANHSSSCCYSDFPFILLTQISLFESENLHESAPLQAGCRYGHGPVAHLVRNCAGTSRGQS